MRKHERFTGCGYAGAAADTALPIDGSIHDSLDVLSLSNWPSVVVTHRRYSTNCEQRTSKYEGSVAEALNERRALTFEDTRLPLRFWKKCIPEPNSGCWLWIGALSDGYGQLRWPDGTASSKRVYAHRVVVAAEGRAIPEGYTLDHRCETTCCANPAHLDVVTNEENIARFWQRHPHVRCLRGHLLCDVGVYLDRRGARHCRKCTLEQQRARREARIVRGQQ